MQNILCSTSCVPLAPLCCALPVQTTTLEFTRDRKMMSVLCSDGDKQVLYCKGAPEVILERSAFVLCNEGTGSVEPMAPELRRQIADRFQA